MLDILIQYLAEGIAPQEAFDQFLSCRNGSRAFWCK